MSTRYGHLAPFLEALRVRSGLTLTALAEASGVAIATMHRRLQSPAGLGTDAILKAARACGATESELEQVRALDALDRGHLPLPEGSTEASVRAALVAMGMGQ